MKAANLLINNKGILKIADFGLARTYDEPPPSRGHPPAPVKREYTNCVVTRWYRPPELLLGERRYGPPVDMWGVGAVFAEMMRTKPLIDGRSDLDQLIKTFRLCGSPTQESMPGYDQLPGVVDDVKIDFSERYDRVLEREMMDFLRRVGVAQHTADLAVDLLSKLLLLDPTKRLSALSALEHEYFTTPPLPSRPGDLPMYEASHELTRRKRELRAQAPRGQHQANDVEGRGYDRRRRFQDGDFSGYHWGAGGQRDDARQQYRSSRGDSWRPGDRRRTPSPRPKESVKPPEPEVKYGRR
jgi:serine/threonine-protein kinase BUR1